MDKFKMWWWLKGRDKVKKAIGRTCRYFLSVSIGFIILCIIIYYIVECGWRAVWGLCGVALFFFIVFAAIEWGDKQRKEK